jgi:hypothetical protein
MKNPVFLSSLQATYFITWFNGLYNRAIVNRCDSIEATPEFSIGFEGDCTTTKQLKRLFCLVSRQNEATGEQLLCISFFLQWSDARVCNLKQRVGLEKSCAN